MAELIEFAQLMCKAGPMIGKAFRENPGACAGIIQRAMQWRMDPYAVSQKAYVTNDAIAYEAQLVNAVIVANAPIEERPRYAFDGVGDKRTCTVTVRIKGEAEPVDYRTPELARIRKNSPLWKDDPDQQLTYFAIRSLARRHFPDIILGVYTVEEMQEARVIENAPRSGFDEYASQEVETDERPKRLSSAQAKRDGTWTVMQAEIEACATLQEIDDWFALNETAIAKLPNEHWRIAVSDRYESKRERILDAMAAADQRDASQADGADK